MSLVESSRAASSVVPEERHDTIGDSDNGVVTAEELVHHGFNPHPPICLVEEPNHACSVRHPSARRGRPWLVHAGSIGSDPRCRLSFTNQGLDNNHATIKLNRETERYQLKDNHSTTGTYLLLSSSKACRERVALKQNDQIVIGTQPKQSSSSKLSVHTSSVGTSIHSGIVTLEVVSLNRVLDKALVARYRRLADKKRDRARAITITRTNSLSRLLHRTASIGEEDDRVEELSELIAQDQIENSKSAEPTSAIMSKYETELNELRRPIHVRFGKLNKPKRLGMNGPQTDAGGGGLVTGSHVGNVALSSNGEIIENEYTEGDSLIEEPEKENITQRIKDNVEYGDSGYIITVVIEVTSGPPELHGKRFEMVDDAMTIGSHPSNTICTGMVGGVSDVHAKIERKGNKVWLSDLAMGNPKGTRLKLSASRGVQIYPNDVFFIGHQLQLVAIKASSLSNASEVWIDMAVKMYRTRVSNRGTKFTQPDGAFDPYYVVFGRREELTIGRRVKDCTLSIRDYDLPAFAGMISYFQGRFFIESLADNKKKGLFRLIGRGDSDPGAPATTDYTKQGEVLLPAQPGARRPPHPIALNDIFKIGRSMFKVAGIRTQPEIDRQALVEQTKQDLMNIPLMNGLTPTELVAVANCVFAQKFAPDEQIVQQGQRTGRLYIIKYGLVHVTHDCSSKVLATLSAGDHFGEMSLLLGFTNATVQAHEETECWVLDYRFAKSLLSEDSLEIIRLLTEKRKREGMVLDLQQSDAFKHLPSSRLNAIAARMKDALYGPGDIVFRNGTLQNKLYFLTFGTVSLTDATDQGIDDETDRATISPRREGRGSDLNSILANEEERGALNILCDTEVIVRGDTNYLVTNDAVALVDTHCLTIDLEVLRDIVKKKTETELEAEDHVWQDHVETVLHGKKGRMKRSMSTKSDITDGDSSKASYRVRNKVAPFELGSNEMSKTRSKAYRSEVMSNMNTDEGAEGEVFSSSPSVPRTPTSFVGNQRARLSSFIETSNANTPRISDPTGGKKGNSIDEGTGEESDEDVMSTLSTNSLGSLSSSEYENYEEHDSDTLTEEELNQKPYYIVLKGISGPLRKKTIVLDSPITILGRRKVSTAAKESAIGVNANAAEIGGGSKPSSSQMVKFISMNDRTVSPENSIVEYRSGAFYLADLQSKYGTFVRLGVGEEYLLEPGDVFECSQHEFQIHALMEVNIMLRSKCCVVS